MTLKKTAKKILLKTPTFFTVMHVLNFKLKHLQNFSKIDGKEKELLLEIKKNGFVVVPDFFDKELCNACIKDIDWMIENKKEYVQKTNDFRIFGAEDLSDNVMKFASDKLLNNLANHYNAADTCNAFTLAARIEASGDKYGSGGPWHRDSFFRQFKAMLYLNKVNENNGPFQLISNSHKLTPLLNDTRAANLPFMESSFSQEMIDKILRDDPTRMQTITGNPGTLILVDTAAIHHGTPLKSGVRYALTNYYFERKQINSHLVEHFSPLVSPEKVLRMGQNQ
ncbi:MAG: phytanoyl-CoA dioxygenase family protein [Nitrosopumilaceae archaeon]